MVACPIILANGFSRGYQLYSLDATAFCHARSLTVPPQDVSGVTAATHAAMWKTSMKRQMPVDLLAAIAHGARNLCLGYVAS